jgi:hypothetical protein
MQWAETQVLEKTQLLEALNKKEKKRQPYNKPITISDIGNANKNGIER